MTAATRVSVLVAAVATLAAGIVDPGVARAFSEATTFGASAAEGGGGGRWFTGSSKDGYTCAVCHTGGETPEIEIEGVPSSYVPGETYDFEIVLPDDGEISSTVVELAGTGGAMVGAMGMPASVGADEECEEGAPAGQHLDLPGDREVVAMDACGARRLRFSWTAPSEPRGAIWFHAAAVAGDASGDPTGDGVRTFAKVIPLQGSSAVSTEVGSACSASRGGPGGGGWPPLLAVLVALKWTRKRRATRR